MVFWPFFLGNGRANEAELERCVLSSRHSLLIVEGWWSPRFPIESFGFGLEQLLDGRCRPHVVPRRSQPFAIQEACDGGRGTALEAHRQNFVEELASSLVLVGHPPADG